MTRYTSYLLLTTLICAISSSSSVAVLSDKNNLEPIKPSPVDESQVESSSDKSSDKFAPLAVETISDNTKSHESILSKKSEKVIEEEKTKRTRTIPSSYSSRLTERDNLSCCGNRFDSSSGRLEPLQVTTRSTDTTRYPERYGNRPDDRFSWHSSLTRPGGTSSSNDGQYGGSNPDRRFGLRPSYLNHNDSEYGRPGSSTRPTRGRPGYGYGYGGYGDSGAYGSHGFEVNQRPGSIHFSGSSNRPGGGYGIYGTVGEQDEFPAAEGGGVNGQIPPNIHTQKAVALKALAGVALIGAAAALAANPALLPVGAVLAGRKRRSTQESIEFNLLEFPEQFIRNHVPKIYEDDKVVQNFWNSSQCVARLACELQKEYMVAIKNDPKLRLDVQRRLDELITGDILTADYVRQSMSTLIKITSDMNTKEGKCSIFTCDLFVL